MRIVLFVFLLLSKLAWAADINPLAHGKISPAQWQTYYKQISTDPAAVKHEMTEEKLVTFSNDGAGRQYVFTLPGNPAHPAALAREIDVQDGKVSVREVGYFAGNEAEFKQLFGAFSEHNRRFVTQANRQKADAPAFAPDPAPEPVQGPASIGFSTVAQAYAALQDDPSAKFGKEKDWLIVDVQEGPNAGTWSFTPKGHPAHPAVIKRTPVEKNGEIFLHMQALCGASKEICDRLVKELKPIMKQPNARPGGSRRAGTISESSSDWTCEV